MPPDEFKDRNQISAGFEVIFLCPTINKDVDGVSYIYDQQRFINYTRDAVKRKIDVDYILSIIVDKEGFVESIFI